MVTGSFPGV